MNAKALRETGKKAKLCWFGIALLCAVFGTARAGEVSVAVAANFTGASRIIAAEFEAATGHRVKASFGSTGKLYAQIVNGAPFEVFLAADSVRPARLEKEGVAVKGSRFTYAGGRLVLWSPDEDRVDPRGNVLGSSDFRKLALANPATAPYGLAARQVLENLDLWEGLRSKVVRGDSIAQTFQFVATRNAQLGFVARSQVLALPEAERGSWWDIGPELYQPIRQQAVLLERGKSDPAVQAFIAYIKSDEVRKIIEGLGYDSARPLRSFSD
ncbi:molybdate ABC transporter substrate-binding protein [Thiohalomonas denitrificans]|uniref:molybdate ABC transporter substrate-binding protein n=1 Tax=Thiohalomonas denitrificans TaxID=415747 RepID=UPI0026ED8286|nr:molybdate ABC transporter substrate-binding protein [Thiohalomonas denitrificans]